MEEPVVNLADAYVNSLSINNSSQRSPFDNLYAFLANNVPSGSSNLPGNSINPFAGDAGIQLQQLIFNRLQLVLGDNSNNPFIGSDNPFIIGNSPIGNGNRDFGNNSAIIGNFNSNFASDNATIGNGNWYFNTNNTTIGNGNWYFGESNTTIGNGNWYWDYAGNNATLGNGNWQFGSDNVTIGNGNWYFGTNSKTIGNGNWDFGTNNTIIGNGNWIFTSNNTVIGNGTRLIDSDNINIGFDNKIDNLDFIAPATRTGIDNTINSLVGRIGQDFIGLTGNLGIEEIQTFNRLILARGNEANNNNLSSNIEQLVNLLTGIPLNYLPSQPVTNPQSVPESTSSLSLIVFAVVCFLISKFVHNKKFTY